MTEEELILELRQQSRKGRETLYDQYAVKLFRVILSRVKDREQAEIALLKIFQTIWAEIDHYDAIHSRLPVWMMAIARRIAVRKR